MTATLGLRANARQFALLVALNAVVGASVGLERSVLPLVGERDFGIESKSAILAFIAAFGAAKAVANVAAGRIAGSGERKRVLVAGWLLAAPVAPLIALAPSWPWVVVANVFLGASQGFAWSMTVLMKIDLVGPARRGLALGLNESAGYLGVALTAFVTGALAGAVAPRTLVWCGAALLTGIGALAAVFLVRDTAGHVWVEQRSSVAASAATPVLVSAAQAGFVNNLNDALAWGLAPLYLAAHGATTAEIGIVAAVYPAVWGAAQVVTGWLSDHVGRQVPIAVGMAVQAGALLLLGAAEGNFAGSLVAAALLGVGTALVYPTLLAAVSDAVAPAGRAHAIGAYRFWRDAGFVAGALVAGIVADAAGAGTAIVAVAVLTGLSGAAVAATPWRSISAPAMARIGNFR